MKAYIRSVRPTASPGFERRFETPPGRQAQVDFAYFRTTFTDEPGAERVVWLFSLVLGHSRFLWGRFVPHQDLQTVLRCLASAFTSIDGMDEQVLFDRMKTAVRRPTIPFTAKETSAPSTRSLLPRQATKCRITSFRF